MCVLYHHIIIHARFLCPPPLPSAVAPQRLLFSSIITLSQVLLSISRLFLVCFLVFGFLFLFLLYLFALSGRLTGTGHDTINEQPPLVNWYRNPGTTVQKAHTTLCTGWRVSTPLTSSCGGPFRRRRRWHDLLPTWTPSVPPPQQQSAFLRDVLDADVPHAEGSRATTRFCPPGEVFSARESASQQSTTSLYPRPAEGNPANLSSRNSRRLTTTRLQSARIQNNRIGHFFPQSRINTQKKSFPQKTSHNLQNFQHARRTKLF